MAVERNSVSWQGRAVPQPFVTLDAVDTPEGRLELFRRSERDFMITIAGRVLMTSRHTRSEQALARLGCGPVAGRARPRVLLGGLGLGYTLRAALDVLSADARVTVAELNPVVAEWCRGAASAASEDALGDARVEVVVGDVTRCIRDVAGDTKRPRYDAILLDLYVGPGPTSKGSVDPLYGRAILDKTRDALSAGGVYAVWGEEADPAFERRLEQVGFRAQGHPVDGGGPRHRIFVGTRAR